LDGVTAQGAVGPAHPCVKPEPVIVVPGLLIGAMVLAAELLALARSL